MVFKSLLFTVCTCSHPQPTTQSSLCIYLFISAHVQELEEGNHVPSQLGQEKKGARDWNPYQGSYGTGQHLFSKAVSQLEVLQDHKDSYQICRVKYRLEGKL